MRASYLVQFVVVGDGEQNVPRYDSLPFVVARRVAGQFEHLGAEIFEHAGHVDGRGGRYATLEDSLAQISPKSPDGKLNAGAIRSRYRLFASFASASRHDPSCFFDRPRLLAADPSVCQDNVSFCASALGIGSRERLL